jgi:DNA-binding LytR/AlgR family response regulator
MILHKYREAITEFFNAPFNLMLSIRQRLRFIGVCSIFVIFFINLFKPFNMDRWFEIPAHWEPLFYSSFGLIAVFVIGISQFIIRPVTGASQSIGSFLRFAIGEIFVLTLIVNFFFGISEVNFSSFIEEFPMTLKYTVLVSGLAYSFALLINAIFYIQNLKKNVELEKLEETKQIDSLISFEDEKESFKFSLKGTDILYIEAADNYVEVHTYNGEKKETHLLRNSMKKLEEPLEPFGIIRCHRSFMVNKTNIKHIKKEQKKYLLYLIEETVIPASPSFFNQFS